VPRPDGGGLHDDETGPPVGPDARQPYPEDPVPPQQAGAANGPLEHSELMSQREVLEGEGRRSEEQGAEEGPETDHEQHGATPASGMTSELGRDSTGSAMEVVR